MNLPLLEISLHLDGTDLFFIIATLVAVAVVCFFYFRQPAFPATDKPAIAWRKFAPYLGLLAFLLLYPFVPPFLHAVTNFFYGVGDRTVEVAEPSQGVRALALLGDSVAAKQVDSLAAAATQTVAAAQANAGSAEIQADQLAGGGVQLGTFFTKLWITIIFYLLFTGLPWWIQRYTHPAPTAWAKESYKADFAGLEPQVKFESYGRLQLINTLKIVGAGLIAALLV